MAAAATAVKLHLRASRLQEAAVLIHERAWVQEAVGDLAKRGRFLWGVISKKSSVNHVPSGAGAAVLGSTGLIGPSSRPTVMSAGIIPTDPVESLATNCNPTARKAAYGSSKLTLQAHAAVAAVDIGRDGQAVSYNARKGAVAETELSANEDDDYRWETDPNGGWLASFP